MRCKQKRPRISAFGAGLAAALVLAGCGSGSERHAEPRPTLPRDVALRLAHVSDGVVAALAAGDACRARTLAQTLRQQARTAVVPAALRTQLQSATNDLARRIECVPPPPPTVAETQPKEEKEHDRGKHKGEKKHEKKHGKEHD
jgi:hypothetical protein